MENQNQISSGKHSLKDTSLATQDYDKGARSLAEYLFVNLPFDTSASDEILAILPENELDAFTKTIHFYLQAHYEASLAEAERCLNSPYPEITTFALLAHALNSVALNDIDTAQKDFQDLKQRTEYHESKRVTALYDIYRFVMSAFFHLGEKIDPITPEHFSHYSEASQLYALYAQSYSLYLQQEYAQALGVAKAALIMDANRRPVICIYLNLLACMAAMSLSYFDQADHFFLNALQISKPHKYIQPFIGHHGPLQGLVEKHIRDQEPELYKMIAEKIVRFRSGWSDVHNPQTANKVTSLLTPYEYGLAMMAAKGNSNQEIADYFSISVNTVKARLSTIYRKIGITKRSELQKHLNK